jgi:hypothetical protein
MPSNKILDELITAHGGRNRWQSVETIEASFSSGGLAFTAHMQPSALRALRISVAPHAPRVVLHDFCHHDWRGIWTPNHVEIRDDKDKLVLQRSAPREQFNRLPKLIRWDRLDILYFAGYALWNYLSFPFILDYPGVSVTELPAATPGDADRLLATFDSAIATHSATQVFHVDSARRLLRHDYTADVIGRLATAANLCLSSEQVTGLRFYTRRKVFPRFGHGLVMPVPTLVWIEIDDIRVTMA